MDHLEAILDKLLAQKGLQAIEESTATSPSTPAKKIIRRKTLRKTDGPPTINE